MTQTSAVQTAEKTQAARHILGGSESGKIEIDGSMVSVRVGQKGDLIPQGKGRRQFPSNINPLDLKPKE